MHDEQPLFSRQKLPATKAASGFGASAAHGPCVGDYKYSGCPLGLSPFWSPCTPLAASLNSPHHPTPQTENTVFHLRAL